MSTKKQILVSVALVVAAGLAVAFARLTGGNGTAASGETGGYDHAAAKIGRASCRERV